MNCLEFRRMTMERPDSREPEYLRHRLECAACREWQQRRQAFDARLAEALNMDVPEGLKERVMMRAQWARPRRRRFAAAAAVLVMAAGTLFGWNWYADGRLQGEALGDEVIAHIYHEPELLVDGTGPADPRRTRSVLTRVGVRVEDGLDGLGEITHAGLCMVGGRLAAHLVVAGERGPVAVLVMPGRGIERTMPVADDRLHGTILPAGRGSIAVIGFRGETTGEIAERMRRRISLEI